MIRNTARALVLVMAFLIVVAEVQRAEEANDAAMEWSRQ
jgi:hypothetical protein